MVNGMIVDGLGHVSLDSGNAPQMAATNLSRANIHQGKQARVIKKAVRKSRGHNVN
jgi:hypothetical protein